MQNYNTIDGESEPIMDSPLIMRAIHEALLEKYANDALVMVGEPKTKNQVYYDNDHQQNWGTVCTIHIHHRFSVENKFRGNQLICTLGYLSTNIIPYTISTDYTNGQNGDGVYVRITDNVRIPQLLNIIGANVAGFRSGFKAVIASFDLYKAQSWPQMFMNTVIYRIGKVFRNSE